jgi:hypothetical protein
MIKTNKPIQEIRLLNQGTYGCIFYPGIACSGKMERKQYVTKVQKKKDTSENELKIGNYIKKIKFYGMYFAPILKSCPISIAKIEQEEIKKCELFDEQDLEKRDNKNQENQEFISNKIRYVGENTLQKHLMNHLYSDIYTFFPHFLETHIYLTNSIDKLVKINVLHYDIKENNIIYDSKNHVPIIVDFGLSFNIKELTQKTNFEKNFYTYYDKYSPWCLEIILISFIISENREDWDTRHVPIENINEAIDSFFLNNEVMIILSRQMDITPYIKQWKIYIRKYIHKTGMEFIKELLKYWNTWDHYGISVMYLFMLYDFHWIVPNTEQITDKETNYETNKKIPFLFQYQMILSEYILSIPNKRMTSKKIMEKIQHIGETIDTNEYNQWIKETIKISEDIIPKQKSRFLETKDIEKQLEQMIYNQMKI